MAEHLNVALGKSAPTYGNGVVSISDAGLEAFLYTPAELVEVFTAPSYRPPVLPSVAIELHDLSRKANCDLRAVTKLLERDPLLAARVLRAAQSPVYATRVALTSLDDALRRLGIVVVAQIVLEVTMGMTLFRVQGYEQPMDRIRRHCTATAYLTRAVAHAANMPTELGFMAGLFHDIGLVACLLVFSKPPPGQPVPAFDDVWPVAGPVHEQVSELLVRMWKLPVEIQEAVRMHHQPLRKRLTTPTERLAGACMLADAIATELGLGVEPAIDPMERDAMIHELGISEPRMKELMVYAQTVVDQIA